jgi:hypothetical protein
MVSFNEMEVFCITMTEGVLSLWFELNANGLKTNEVNSSFKIYILLDMADSIPYLVPTQFQESILSP